MLVKWNQVGFGIGIYTGVLLPNVTIIVVVLVGVFLACIDFRLSSFHNRKIHESFISRFDYIIVAIITGWIVEQFSGFLPRLLIKVNILADMTLDLTNRFHDVNFPPINALNLYIFSTCHPGHVDHTLAFTQHSRHRVISHSYTCMQIVLSSLYIMLWRRLRNCLKFTLNSFYQLNITFVFRICWSWKTLMHEIRFGLTIVYF